MRTAVLEHAHESAAGERAPPPARPRRRPARARRRAHLPRRVARQFAAAAPIGLFLARRAPVRLRQRPLVRARGSRPRAGARRGLAGRRPPRRRRARRRDTRGRPGHRGRDGVRSTGCSTHAPAPGASSAAPCRSATAPDGRLARSVPRRDAPPPRLRGRAGRGRAVHARVRARPDRDLPAQRRGRLAPRQLGLLRARRLSGGRAPDAQPRRPAPSPATARSRSTTPATRAASAATAGPTASRSGCRLLTRRTRPRRRDALHVVQAEDIGDRKQAERELRQLADHDALTGLLNRRGFMDGLHRELRRMDRRGEYGALLVLDLDNFKLVNDTAGHMAGDQVLRTTAEVLRRRLRAPTSSAGWAGTSSPPSSST